MNKTKRSLVIRKIIGILLLVGGFCIATYPLVLNVINSREMSSEIEEYEQTIHKIASENKEQTNDKKYRSLDELYAKLQTYNEDLAKNGQHFTSLDDYERFDIDLTEYGLTKSVIGVIEIPKIDEKIPLYLGTEDDNMYKGVTVVGKTSAPIGGINTNCLISGHRGYIGATMFRHIDELEEGDKIYIRNPWGVLTYEAFHIEIIEANAIGKVMIRPGEDVVTLMSCHPYRINNKRYIVVCKRV